MEIILTITIITLLAACYVIWNLNKKVVKLEDVVESQIEYLRKVSTTIQESNLYINQLDEKGHFRSDDELGIFFNFMKEIQEVINSFRLPDQYGKKEKN